VSEQDYHFRCRLTIGGNNNYTIDLAEDGTWVEKATGFWNPGLGRGAPTKFEAIGFGAIGFKFTSLNYSRWVNTTEPFIAEAIPTDNAINEQNIDRYRYFRRVILYSQLVTPREGQGLQRTHESEESLDQYSFLVRDINRDAATDVFDLLRDILIDQPTSGYYKHYRFGNVETRLGVGEYEISFPVDAILAGKAREVP
jgi:hypothetical protein